MNFSITFVNKWYHLQCVEESVQRWEVLAESLSLSRCRDNHARFGGGVKGISRQLLPVVKHALGEGLSTSVGTKVTCESCGFVEGDNKSEWK